MQEAVIVSAVRTAVGKAPKGTLRDTRPDEMGAAVIKEAMARVPGLEADVTIEDIGDASTQVTTDVDAAYRTKYVRGGAGSMVTATAAATTLQLNHE